MRPGTDDIPNSVHQDGTEGDVVEVVGAAAVAVRPAVDLAGSLRLRFRLRHPLLVQVVRFALVGGLGTGTNALIFLIARYWFDAVPANLLALVLSTALSTEVNRRFTFGAAMTHRWRTHVQTGGTVAFYAFYSSTVLLLLGMAVDGPTPVQESLAVAGASVLGGIARFLVLRLWVFGPDELAHDELPDRTVSPSRATSRQTRSTASTWRPMPTASASTPRRVASRQTR